MNPEGIPFLLLIGRTGPHHEKKRNTKTVWKGFVFFLIPGKIPVLDDQNRQERPVSDFYESRQTSFRNCSRNGSILLKPVDLICDSQKKLRNSDFLSGDDSRHGFNLAGEFTRLYILMAAQGKHCGIDRLFQV